MVELEKAELFRLLKPDQLAALSQAAQQRHYQPGQAIFRAGDPGDGLYVVKSGLVEISGQLSGNARQIFSQIKPGEIFGEMAIVDRLPRSAYATAVSVTTVAFLGHDQIEQLLEQSPVFATALLKLVSHRLRDFNLHYLQEVLQAERLAAVGQFARSIVHDIKNPLSIISLTAEMLSKPDLPLSARASELTRIHKQLERVNDLISDMLHFTHGGQTPSLLPVNFLHFIEEVQAELAPELQSRSVHLSITTPVPDVVLPLDVKRLRRVFYNLATNAAEVMPDEGTICLRFEQSGSELVSEMEDSGPGIAPEIFDRLFQPFVTHGKTHGSGLGLSICRKIVEDHGGRITAWNSKAGGAVFSFTLPI